MNQRMERPTERVSPTGPRVLVLAGVLLSISLTDASWTYRCADHVTPGGGRMRQGRRQTILPARSPLSGFSSDSVTMHVPYLVSTVSPSFGRSGNSRSWMSFQLMPSMVTVNFFMRRSSHACVRGAHCGDKERQPTTRRTVSGLLLLLLILLVVFAIGGGILLSKLLWLLLIVAAVVLIVGLFTGRTA